MQLLLLLLPLLLLLLLPPVSPTAVTNVAEAATWADVYVALVNGPGGALVPAAAPSVACMWGRWATAGTDSLLPNAFHDTCECIVYG